MKFFKWYLPIIPNYWSTKPTATYTRTYILELYHFSTIRRWTERINRSAPIKHETSNEDVHLQPFTPYTNVYSHLKTRMWVTVYPSSMKVHQVWQTHIHFQIPLVGVLWMIHGPTKMLIYLLLIFLLVQVENSAIQKPKNISLGWWVTPFNMKIWSSSLKRWVQFLVIQSGLLEWFLFPKIGIKFLWKHKGEIHFKIVCTWRIRSKSEFCLEWGENSLQKERYFTQFTLWNKFSLLSELNSILLRVSHARTFFFEWISLLWF